MTRIVENSFELFWGLFDASLFLGKVNSDPCGLPDRSRNTRNDQGTVFSGTHLRLAHEPRPRRTLRARGASTRGLYNLAIGYFPTTSIRIYFRSAVRDYTYGCTQYSSVIVH